jgi:hypothetical protein
VADPLIAVEELRAYLLAEGIGQDNNTRSGALPSVWVGPRQGAPEPDVRAGEEATITLIDAQLRSPSSMESWMEEAFIDVIVRAKNAGQAKLIHRTIRARLHPDNAPGGRKQWMMGGLLVENSMQWRGEQPLPQPADSQSYGRVQGFCITARVKSLNGEPLTP